MPFITSPEWYGHCPRLGEGIESPLRVRMVLLLCAALVSGACLNSGAFAQSSTAKIPTTGRANPQLASFDHLFVGFLHERQLPGGASLAVARNGRLVYARGYGYADEETKEPVQSNSLFRIASISKPLTAVAILQLVERGRLRLNDSVFDVLQLQEPAGNDVTFDERWRRVTILHLLQHRGGWDRDKSFDPMFHSRAIVKELKIEPPARPRDIIRYMLRHPLDFNPGARDVYSNFGYCLLGRVIEKVSGQSYEQYVRKEVLAPLGIHDMRVGATLLEKRAPHEVRYHVGKNALAPAVMGPHLGEKVPWPYGAWCLESMDSHGGWLASASDLVRFASAFYDPRRCKILSAKSIAILFARPPGAAGIDDKGKPRDAFYACGWMVRPIDDNGGRNIWHGGYLDGTSTLLVNRNDGLTWAVLFNSSKKTKKELPADAIDSLMHEAADAVEVWPR
ncbi:MAG TPA: serine hydrolase domain-containing protein [Gemmataceae bacterium]|jgi:N-acyl-D-amino-acid deacylase